MVSIIDIKKEFTLDETRDFFSKHNFKMYISGGNIIRYDNDTHVGYVLQQSRLKYKIVIYKRIKNK